MPATPSGGGARRCDTFTKPFRISADFLVHSASLRASPLTRCFAAHLEGRLCGARKRAFPFLYPAFTSQRVRKTAPTLARPFASLKGRLCWATLFRPFRGSLLVARTIDSQ